MTPIHPHCHCIHILLKDFAHRCSPLHLFRELNFKKSDMDIMKISCNIRGQPKSLGQVVPRKVAITVRLLKELLEKY
jgi:hypothetical protein